MPRPADSPAGCIFAPQADMNLTHFISRRLRTGSSDAFTRIIIRFAVGTIALCVAVILLAHALILGFKEEIKAKVFGFWGHIQVTAYNVNHTFESPPIPRDQPFYPNLDTLSRLRFEALDRRGRVQEQLTHGGVAHIHAYGLKPGILTRKNQLEGVLLKGVGEDFRWDFMQAYLQEGLRLRTSDSIPPRDVLISRTTATRMDLSLEDDLIIHFIQQERQVERRFRVGGIFKTGLEEYDRKFALVDIRHLQDLAGWGPDSVTGFEIFIEDIRDAAALADHIYYEYLPPSLYVETIRQKFPAIFDWVDLQDINEKVLLILMLLVAMINLATVLLILVLERYNMVGILKALGASDWTIRKIFIRLSLRILLWGMVLANGLALLLGTIQRQTGLFRLNEADYYLSVVPVHWDPWFFLGLNVFMLLVAALTLLVPSLYVRRIEPVKAIRFK
jgi:lipoprotein-releasing system permease protein